MDSNGELIYKLRKNIDVLHSESKEFNTLWDDTDIESIKYWKIFHIENEEIRESDKIGCLLIVLSMCTCEIQNIASYKNFDPKEIFQLLSDVKYDEESESVKELIDINKKWLRIHYEKTFGFTIEEIQALYKVKEYAFDKFIRPSLQ